MKTPKKTAFTLLLACITCGAGYAQVTTTSYTDTYWGGNPSNTTYDVDVIGNSNVFNLTRSEVIRDVGLDTFEVRIYGNYFDDLLAHSGLSTDNSSPLYGTELGDLFISTDGLSSTDTGAATLDDYFQSTESDETTWEYGVRLGTYLDTANVLEGKAPQTGAMYAITADNQITVSSIDISGYYRNQQEVQLNSANLGAAVGTAPTWYIDTTGAEDFLSIKISDFNTLFGTSGRLGLHWTMTCANDVVEFEWVRSPDDVVVPEPSTIGLLGMAGLMGALFLRRRILRRR